MPIKETKSAESNSNTNRLKNNKKLPDKDSLVVTKLGT